MSKQKPTHACKEPEMNDLPPTTTEGLSPFPPMRRYTGCITPGCDGEHKSRGLCARCYRAAHYRANAARSLELNRLWRAKQRGDHTVSRHPGRVPDVSEAAGGVARGSSVGSGGAPLPGAPAGRPATPVGNDGATTGRGQD